MENAKIEKFKCDILGYFLTLSIKSKVSNVIISGMVCATELIKMNRGLISEKHFLSCFLNVRKLE